MVHVQMTVLIQAMTQPYEKQDKRATMAKIDLKILRDRYTHQEVDGQQKDEGVIALIDAYQEAIKERDRLTSEARYPTCNDCGVELGDNWCARCAGKATQHRLAEAEAALAKIGAIVTFTLLGGRSNS